jgi:capsular polysaccharide transport system permease protein
MAQPVASPARARPRHWMLLLGFVLVVILPTAASAWYLYTRAVDQYASITAFSVRSDESRSALDILGGLGSLGTGGGARDSEILFQFIQSQELVARIDERLDLRGLYSRHHDADPLFGFGPDGTIEDLTEHWSRMVRIAFDNSTGLMELRVLAFQPDEAQAIARAILAESTQRINELSAIAREDATRYAREDLEMAVDRLRNAREALTRFRVRTRIVDPSADIQGQMGLLNTLQAQLADALIELDLLRENTRDGDPRIVQAERRIEIIRDRIEEERALFGGGAIGPGGEDFATVVAEFERLSVDREFAEQAYRSAQSAYDAAVAEAQRTSIYLATHVSPTRAESARYPEREKLLGLTGFFLLLVWSVGALIYYSVRDSR